MNIFLSYHPLKMHTVSYLKTIAHDTIAIYRKKFESKGIKIYDVPTEFLKENQVDERLFNKIMYHSFFYDFVKKNINLNEQNLFFGYAPIGIDIIFNSEFEKLLNNKCFRIIWIEDPHAFYKKKTNIYEMKNFNKKEFYDKRLYKANLILTPSPIFFKNLGINLYQKTLFYFYGFDLREKYFKTIIPYHQRKNKILLSGNISKKTYPSRYIIQKRLLGNKKHFFKDQFELLEHPGYFNSGNCNKNIIWFNYYDIIQKYKVAFIGLARFPLNFLLAKIIETLVCGTLALIEESPLLEKELGLIDGVHYVSVPFRNDELILTNNEIEKYYHDEKYVKIAQQGRLYALENFNIRKNVRIINSICKYFKEKKNNSKIR